MSIEGTPLELGFLAICNERQDEKRRQAIILLWSRQGSLWSSEGIYAGHDAINRASGSLLKRFPEFAFYLTGLSEEFREETGELSVARLRWSFGAHPARPAFTGEDIIIMDSKLITATYRFLDGPAL